MAIFYHQEEISTTLWKSHCNFLVCAGGGVLFYCYDVEEKAVIIISIAWVPNLVNLQHFCILRTGSGCHYKKRHHGDGINHKKGLEIHSLLGAVKPRTLL